ncbi:sugar ABC transporter substrate-binding protein [Deinococcus oregonensis]|uniref:Sugar ABC transporter substrate-binding protein n=1 Tax=Deinococcus oregonensis TaxID=1805970 RepID=A0ABV6AV79_9DEIO
MKNSSPLVVLASLGLLLNVSGQAAPTAVPTVGLVMKSLGNEFFKTMQEGAVAHAKKLGNVNLLTLGIQNETDLAAQIGLVENLIAKKVSAIVIAPADSRGLVPVLARAVNAGIRVVNIDVRLDPEALKKANVTIPYVGPDNAAASKLSGDVLAKTLGKGAKVIILTGNPGADNAAQRARGFTDAAKTGQLTVVASQTAHWETDEAYTVTTNLLTANPDVKGIMASNDSMALGAVRALQAQGKTGSVRVVGFDNIDAVHPLLKDGSMLATVDQFGAAQASYGIDIALNMLKGKVYTGWVKTKVQLIRPADLK